MKAFRKALRIIVLSNLAVFGFIMLLPALLVTGDIEIVREFIDFLNKD
ncbi:hypothetical protein [Bacillus sp. Marseille-Q3570]|nr:hypothetical protein [Bacillus sp. Marseille-Q3570]